MFVLAKSWSRVSVGIILASLCVAAMTIIRPASAQATTCGASTLCLFMNAYYEGEKWEYPYADYPSEQWFYVGTEENDETSSFDNNREHSTLFAQDADGYGYQACSTANGDRENLAELIWPTSSDESANDSISSIFFTAYETGCTTPEEFREGLDARLAPGETSREQTGPSDPADKEP